VGGERQGDRVDACGVLDQSRVGFKNQKLEVEAQWLLSICPILAEALFRPRDCSAVLMISSYISDF